MLCGGLGHKTILSWYDRTAAAEQAELQHCDSFMNAPNGNKKERERILQLVARHVTFATYYLRESFQTYTKVVRVIKVSMNLCVVALLHVLLQCQLLTLKS